MSTQRLFGVDEFDPQYTHALLVAVLTEIGGSIEIEDVEVLTGGEPTCQIESLDGGRVRLSIRPADIEIEGVEVLAEGELTCQIESLDKGARVGLSDRPAASDSNPTAGE